MQTTLLSTKLYIPPTRETLVARPRLTTILSAALGKSLTLISAPAGYGKTTLVSSWLRAAGLPCAWLSLEESDNDPVSFMQYLLTAFQGVIPTVRLDLLDMVDGIKPVSYQALMNILINEIARQTSRFVLVMDDFHLINDPFILDLVGFLLDHLPARQMHLVIVTRSDPPIPLSRLRVRNQMVEIRADQLRFTVSEVDEFINGVMGLALSDRDLDTMLARTEGWVAGLQLAGLSMQECTDIPGFITAFSGSHHYIVDYLAEEVLKRQDEGTRSFLLRTSVLSRMCASLCDSLLGIESTAQALDGQKFLESLQQKNLFIIPLDEELRWFRYHHLFADALTRRLEHQFPLLPAELYRRASAWYEDNGLIREAIQYALSAGDQERVAQLVEGNGCYLLMSGEVLTLLKWVEAVESYYPAHPWLVIQKGWALAMAGRSEAAERAFLTAENMVSALQPVSGIGTMRGTISAGRAYLAELRGNVPEAASLARQALDCLTDMDGMSQSMRSVATSTLAKSMFFTGQLAEARQIYDRAVEIEKAANNTEMIINTNCEICDILVEQGKLKQAERILLEILPMTGRTDGQRLPLCARIYSSLATIYYQWDKLDQAGQNIQQCLATSQQWGNIEQQAVATVLSAKLEQANGKPEKAIALVKIAEQFNRDYQLYPWTSKWISPIIYQLWISSGNLELVEEYLRSCGIGTSDDLSFLNELSHLTLLRWLLASGSFDAALVLSQRMLQFAQEGERTGRVIELLILQSLANLGLKDHNSAVRDLSQALLLAQHEGYQRVFLDEGEGIRKLLYLMKTNPGVAEYASQLLAAFGPSAGAEPWADQLLIEPLSEREIEVLRLIEAGLSNQGIASRLFISTATVKRHISNIYSKLDVKNRTQAVSRGKELGFFQ